MRKLFEKYGLHNVLCQLYKVLSHVTNSWAFEQVKPFARSDPLIALDHSIGIDLAHSAIMDMSCNVTIQYTYGSTLPRTRY